MFSTKIGILGGGQLGLMLVQAAIDWNLELNILDPDKDAPCKNLATTFTHGSLQDFDTVYNFGKDLDVITIEIEKVSIEALEVLEAEGKKVYPQPSVLRLIQDKRLQKQFYQDNNIPTADFVLTDTKQDIKKHADFLPAFHKLGKDGYDGRGVKRIKSVEDWELGFDAPGVLEKLIPFEKEIAVIVGRKANGEMVTFPTVEMVFHPEHNLVDYLFAPATISAEIEAQANEIALKVADTFGIVGLLAVEMFVTKEGTVLVNEVAPRPHNSGHHTIRANATSQFEQHWRAILGLPLGSTKAYGPAAMVNVLGEDGYEGKAIYDGMEVLLAESEVFPFLYGKAITRPFRKMGHVTVMGDDVSTLQEKVKLVQDSLKVIS